MSDEKKPGGFGKRPTGGKPFGKKPFGDRGPRREGGGFGGKRGSPEGGRRFGGGDRGPRREGGGFRADRGPKRWGDRPASRPAGSGPTPHAPGGGPIPRPAGEARDAGDRPFRKRPFGDRGPRREGDDFRDRGMRREEGPRPGGFGSRERRSGPGRPERNENSRFRGMYSGPASTEQREWRSKRSYRPDPRPEKDLGPDAAPTFPTPNAEGGQERPHLADNELRYHGRNACLALLKSRPGDIVRVYVLRELAAELSPLIEYCAKNHKAYHLVDAGDLERLCDSIHHQGVVVIARAKRFFKEEIFFRELGAHRTLVIYLDGVANPHNLGAILRTAAHFGVKWVCVPMDEISKISPALYRTAEGGAELVNLVRVEDAEKFLDRLRAGGFQLYAFEPGEKTIPLFDTRLNEKSVFVFGAEVEGLSGLVKSIVETKVTIPGTGEIESLNVSVAAAVAMAEFERQGQAPRAVRIVKSKT